MNAAYKYEVWIWKPSSKLKVNFKPCLDATDNEVKQFLQCLYFICQYPFGPPLNLSSSSFDQTGQKTALFQDQCNTAKQHSRWASTSAIDFSPSCDHSLFVTFSCQLFNILQPNQFHIFVNASQLDEPDGMGHCMIYDFDLQATVV